MTELEKYREIYNQFLSLIVQLHNVNVRYSQLPGRETGIELRGILRKLRKVEKNLWMASQRASKEALAIKRAEAKAKKEAQIYRKLHPKSPGRPKKEKQNGKHNITTTNPIQ